MVWSADETYFSMLSYEQKMKIFGEGYNTHGLEYYSEGFFEFLSEVNTRFKSSKVKETPQLMFTGAPNNYIKSFDWRKRHDALDEDSPYYDSENDNSGWMTKVKCQSGCWIDNQLQCIPDSVSCISLGGEWRAVGTCWAFSAVGAAEAIVNLYYNDHLDYDLSEQNIVSCVFKAEPYYISEAMKYIVNQGVVTEECFPYQAADGDCTNDICSNPSERIRFYSRGYVGDTVDDYKRDLIPYGPLPCKMFDWGHAVVIVGWDVIKEGDYIDFTGGGNIPPGSPYRTRILDIKK